MSASSGCAKPTSRATCPTTRSPGNWPDHAQAHQAADAKARTKPVEFGSADDYQLAQAMNHLKGKPVVIAKPKDDTPRRASRIQVSRHARRAPARAPTLTAAGGRRRLSPNPLQRPRPVNDEQLLRCSRSLLDEIGIEAQQRLLGATALIRGRWRIGIAGGALPGQRRYRTHPAGR
jgi:hypothetical protein